MKPYRLGGILFLIITTLFLCNLPCETNGLNNNILDSVKAHTTKSITTHNNNSIQTIYSTSTTVNTTTITLVETTGPLFGQGPLLVIYDVELFFEEKDLVKIETSQGARVYINPSLEESERDGWVRLFKVHESGNYKIRVTTGHGADRLFVNIYRISSETYYMTVTLSQSTITPNTYASYSTVYNTTSLITDTDTWINATSNLTSITSQIEDEVEAVPGYSLYALVIGVLVGLIIIVFTRVHTENMFTRT